jgi:hypothetical protein
VFKNVDEGSEKRSNRLEKRINIFTPAYTSKMNLKTKK